MEFNEETYRILEMLFDGVYAVDLDRRITHWNRGAERITGFAADEVVGTRCQDDLLRHVDHEGRCLCRGQCPLTETMADGCRRETEVFLHHRNGHRVPVTVRSMTLRDDRGEVVGALEVFTDASAQESLRTRIAELEKAAFLDHLTELANRRYAEVALEHRLEERKRYGWPFGVIMLDIDDFKLVNDAFGHPVGDRMLRVVATTLALNARRSDVVGRWGGDEFLVVIANTERGVLEDIARRFGSLVESAFLDLGDAKVTVTVSGGVTAGRADDTPASIIERADSLLFEAKGSGRNRIIGGSQ